MDMSMECMRMLDDVHTSGVVAVNALANYFNVSTRCIYAWLEKGFPAVWDQDDHEEFRKQFILATGGAHIIGYFQELASSRPTPQVANPTEHLRKSTTDEIVTSADLLRAVTTALRDGRISECEAMDINAAATAVERGVAAIRSAATAAAKPSDWRPGL